MNETRGLVDVIDAIWGGAVTTMAAALAGRLMWHSTEVRARKRRFFGRELLWDGTGVRYDVELTDISTRGVGRPVDADGLPTTGTPAAASSIDVRGNASGSLNRVKISGANLQGWPGNTAACAITQYCNGVHAAGISWANHDAPSIGTTNVVTANNNAL